MAISSNTNRNESFVNNINFSRKGEDYITEGCTKEENVKKGNDRKESDIKENDTKENDIKKNDTKEENDINKNDTKEENDIKENDIKENNIKKNDIKENDIKKNDTKEENDAKENIKNENTTRINTKGDNTKDNIKREERISREFTKGIKKTLNELRYDKVVNNVIGFFKKENKMKSVSTSSALPNHMEQQNLTSRIFHDLYSEKEHLLNKILKKINILNLIYLRFLKEDDLEDVLDLHKELFPVNYHADFYFSICNFDENKLTPQQIDQVKERAEFLLSSRNVPFEKRNEKAKSDEPTDKRNNEQKGKHSDEQRNSRDDTDNELLNNMEEIRTVSSMKKINGNVGNEESINVVTEEFTDTSYVNNRKEGTHVQAKEKEKDQQKEQEKEQQKRQEMEQEMKQEKEQQKRQEMEQEIKQQKEDLGKERRRISLNKKWHSDQIFSVGVFLPFSFIDYVNSEFLEDVIKEKGLDKLSEKDILLSYLKFIANNKERYSSLSHNAEYVKTQKGKNANENKLPKEEKTNNVKKKKENNGEEEINRKHKSIEVVELADAQKQVNNCKDEKIKMDALNEEEKLIYVTNTKAYDEVNKNSNIEEETVKTIYSEKRRDYLIGSISVLINYGENKKQRDSHHINNFFTNKYNLFSKGKSCFRYVYDSSKQFLESYFSSDNITEKDKTENYGEQKKKVKEKNDYKEEQEKNEVEIKVQVEQSKKQKEQEKQKENETQIKKEREEEKEKQKSFPYDEEYSKNPYNIRHFSSLKNGKKEQEAKEENEIYKEEDEKYKEDDEKYKKDDVKYKKDDVKYKEDDVKYKKDDEKYKEENEKYKEEDEKYKEDDEKYKKDDEPFYYKRNINDDIVEIFADNDDEYQDDDNDDYYDSDENGVDKYIYFNQNSIFDNLTILKKPCVNSGLKFEKKIFEEIYMNKNMKEATKKYVKKKITSIYILTVGTHEYFRGLNLASFLIEYTIFYFYFIVYRLFLYSRKMYFYVDNQAFYSLAYNLKDTQNDNFEEGIISDAEIDTEADTVDYENDSFEKYEVLKRYFTEEKQTDINKEKNGIVLNRISSDKKEAKDIDQLLKKYSPNETTTNNIVHMSPQRNTNTTSSGSTGSNITYCCTMTNNEKFPLKFKTSENKRERNKLIKKNYSVCNSVIKHCYKKIIANDYLHHLYNIIHDEHLGLKTSKNKYNTTFNFINFKELKNPIKGINIHHKILNFFFNNFSAYNLKNRQLPMQNIRKQMYKQEREKQMSPWQSKFYSQSQIPLYVYLHVIEYNNAAINLYNKLSFFYICTYENFYDINKMSFSSFLYAYFF